MDLDAWITAIVDLDRQIHTAVEPSAIATAILTSLR